ncbi:MAG TPA: LptF/LptG family permease [Tepidisphaeraceae bacterium]|nr:LptF/LptG family permease [Tepidisphaeraceae bacterium]
MKIIDRYVIFSFIRNYVISFMVLVGMYVVLDMVFNFNNLVDLRSTDTSGMQSLLGALYDIFDYYFYQCFLIFVHLSGIIPVVAAAFTLMRLSRFNELTALLAAGVPLLRIAAPVIIVAVVLNGLLLVDQELVIPAMIPKLIREHDDVHRGPRNYYGIEAMQDSSGGLLYAARYFPNPPDKAPYMLDMDVIERQTVTRTEDGQPRAVTIPVAHVQADEAHWNPKTQEWDLQNGRTVSGLMSESVSAPAPTAEYKSNVTPEEISLYRSGNYVELLPTSRINQLLDRPNMYGKIDLLRVKHWRFTQPLMNVILLLLAIPCVLTREPNTLKTAATKTLVLMGVAMGAVFLFQQFAGKPPPLLASTPTGPNTWAMLMAWVPIFIFGPTSVYLLDHVKS